LLKSKLWPKKAVQHKCDDANNLYTIRSDQFFYMNEEDIKTISKLLMANGFESVGNVAKPAFRPCMKKDPASVKDPNAPPFDYSSSEEDG
jgi:hypothetical protein